MVWAGKGGGWRGEYLVVREIAAILRVEPFVFYAHFSAFLKIWLVLVEAVRVHEAVQVELNVHRGVHGV